MIEQPYRAIAKKLAKDMNKDVSYKKSDLPKMLAKADFAAMHSKQHDLIIDELKDMGFKIEESLMRFESFVNESKKEKNAPSRDEMMDLLKKRFPNLSMKKGEKFNDEQRRNRSIWVMAEGSSFVDKDKKVEAFNVKDPSDNRYELEVHKTLNNFLEKNGWYAESYDAGTFFFWPIKND